jgi:hypothetical protein
MPRRALVLLSLATVLAIAASPVSAGTHAPRHAKRGLKTLRLDVLKIARDYSHQRYHAVCNDLTAKERKHFGGMPQCMLRVAVINALVPIKKFTIVSAKLRPGGVQGTISVYVNGNKKHVIHAVAKWEGGKYRLDHQSGWQPKL